MNVNALAAALFLVALLAAPPATAAPRVAADIPPVHSLVGRVMQGVGAPALVMRPGASPHGYAMRPSEAAALAEAEAVFAIGGGLAPWLDRAARTLAPEAVLIELIETPGLTVFGFRESALFEGHDHAAGEHEAHGSAAPADAADPHVWLDPVNAALMVEAIAATLAGIDPAGAALYRANAREAVAELEALTIEIDAALRPVRGRPFLVFHDAFHYFEARFDIEAAGALSLSDAAAPGPARLEAARDAVRALGVACVLAEPQFPSATIAAVTEGTDAKRGELDPLGAGLTPGPDLYPRLMRAMAAGLAACLAR